MGHIRKFQEAKKNGVDYVTQLYHSLVKIRQEHENRLVNPPLNNDKLRQRQGVMVIFWLLITILIFLLVTVVLAFDLKNNFIPFFVFALITVAVSFMAAKRLKNALQYKEKNGGSIGDGLYFGQKVLTETTLQKEVEVTKRAHRRHPVFYAMTFLILSSAIYFEWLNNLGFYALAHIGLRASKIIFQYFAFTYAIKGFLILFTWLQLVQLIEATLFFEHRELETK